VILLFLVTFTDVTAQAGISFQHDHGGSGRRYIVEIAGGGVLAFDYDADCGALSNERLFAAPHPGFPDGSCVDAEGCLWNAEYGGARVARYTPAGKLDRVVEVPAQNPTCCCFGGSRLDTLFITTQGGAGLFACVPGVAGLPEARLRG